MDKIPGITAEGGGGLFYKHLKNYQIELLKDVCQFHAH